MGQRLGQHFLRDKTVLEQIITAADIHTDDLVLEVGPGRGVLTRELVKLAGSVIAIEKDEQLAQVLRPSLGLAENLTIITADAVQLNLTELLTNALAAQKPATLKVVANIPYQITSPLLFQLIDAHLPLERAVLLIQKEVADRLVAPPKTKARGILTVLTEFWATTEIISLVPPTAFSPPPNVMSALIRLTPLAPPDPLASNPDFRRLVKIAFAQKRKQLKNTLAAGTQLDATEIETWLDRAAISKTTRAEELSPEDWRRLFSTKKTV